MQREFAVGRSLYRRDGVQRLGPRSYAHLWPLSRALFATLDIAGMPAALRPGFDAPVEIADRLAGLEPYWAGDAYDSDVLPPLGRGGDRYYDDNAWIGLGLVQHARLHGAGLDRAELLFRFARGGWDHERGGVYWVEQGRGIGGRNHDRNAVSTAPNAALGLHLAELGGAGGDAEAARAMYDWVVATLAAGDGLYWDKVRGDGSIDRAVWTYNQGSMVAAGVLLGDLDSAEATARQALVHFDRDRLLGQPPAFNAIYFHGLLRLAGTTADRSLAASARASLEAYAEALWAARDRRDRLRPPTLLSQGALVQVLALLAWEPTDYGKLA